MSFDDRLLAFAGRVLADRTFQLIVEPALADLQFERDAGAVRRTANRLAVFRALAFAMHNDAVRACRGMWLLMLLPSAYYIFLLVLFFDIYSIALTVDFLYLSTLIVVLSVGPVVACFLPERGRARPID